MTPKEQEIKSIKEAQRELADRLEALEKLEQRTPEAGDVYGSDTTTWLINSELKWQTVESTYCDFVAHKTTMTGDECGHTYLGKFDEVFVKISDIRDALSHEDCQGDSIMSAMNNDNGCGVFEGGSKKSYEALRKLNIITD